MQTLINGFAVVDGAADVTALDEEVIVASAKECF